ncbi:alpha/beta hydrolase [Phenylobacterium sp.]|uniref:alpha/beta fold hydrolase n=1 Tax=Phenylobacterium sp. TaxID=1871053 RepID=UPI00286BF542|nr:alpha/beta hydrolase [Phenylobacterium sp.]
MHRRQILMGGALAGAALSMTDGAHAAAPAKARKPGPVFAKDGTSLFVRDWGSGQPIVFLAGWTLTSEAWAYQMASLSEAGFRCVAYDRRGHGRSGDPGGGYDYDTLADDLASVLDALDLRGVTLVAHSMAGGEAVRYMTRHGKSGRVKKILFLATTLPCLSQTSDNPTGVPPAYFDQMRQQFATDFPKWIDDNSEPFVVPATSPLMRTWIKDLMLSASLQAAIALNKAMTGSDFRAELAKLSVPSLYIHGDKDASAPLPISGKPAAAATPGSRLVVYEGAPHGLFVTHVPRLNADIAAFAMG